MEVSLNRHALVAALSWSVLALALFQYYGSYHAVGG